MCLLCVATDATPNEPFSAQFTVPNDRAENLAFTLKDAADMGISEIVINTQEAGVNETFFEVSGPYRDMSELILAMFVTEFPASAVIQPDDSTEGSGPRMPLL